MKRPRLPRCRSLLKAAPNVTTARFDTTRWYLLDDRPVLDGHLLLAWTGRLSNPGRAMLVRSHFTECDPAIPRAPTGLRFQPALPVPR